MSSCYENEKQKTRQNNTIYSNGLLEGIKYDSADVISKFPRNTSKQDKLPLSMKDISKTSPSSNMFIRNEQANNLHQSSESMKEYKVPPSE